MCRLDGEMGKGQKVFTGYTWGVRVNRFIK